MISICTVKFLSDDFLKCLLDSIGEHTVEIETVIHTNDDNNLGHAGGLHEAIKNAKGEYILCLDSDAHFLLPNWDVKLLEFAKDYDLIMAQGGLMKPARPCVMFFKKAWFVDNDMNLQAVSFQDLKFDVGVYMYHKAVHTGQRVGFFGYKETSYKDVFGEEYTLNGEPFVYHNYYGSRFVSNKPIDGRSFEDFERTKKNLFDQFYAKETPDQGVS